MRTLICCIGKEENRYIREYIDWYKQLGITNICIFDNNDVDGERFEDVIQNDIDSGFVILRNYRGRKVCQIQAYQECYDIYGEDYDWIFFIDCGDEYLELYHHNNINEFLSQDIFNDYEMIHINLLTFGDCELLHDDGRDLRERFTTPLPLDITDNWGFPVNNHVSSVIRGGLGSRVNWTDSYCPHTPYPCDLKCCDSEGNECEAERYYTDKILSDRAIFFHYTTKTIDEYCNKMLRGYPDQITNLDTIKESLQHIFFLFNTATQQKIDIVKERLGIDMTSLLNS